MSLSDAASQINGFYTGKKIIFNGVSTDSRTIEEGNLFIAIKGEKFDGHDYLPAVKDKGAAGAMIENRDEKPVLPVIQTDNTMRAMAMLAKNWRSRFEIPVIAITGSNGKTTVKEMVSSILGLESTVLSTRGNFNNHVGVPLTLFNLGDKHQFAVIEMGANHAGEIAILSDITKPSVALITQCAPAHLEGFISEEGVAKAKSEIFSGLGLTGVAIINADDKFSKMWSETAKDFKCIYFGIQNEADIYAKNIRLNPLTFNTEFEVFFPESSIPISIPLIGEHNVKNALAAAACCYAVGISESQIRRGLEKMTGVSGRMEMTKGLSGVKIFNDTYNANPASLEAGLKVLADLGGTRWLILGDMGELGNQSEYYHQHAGKLARDYDINRLYTLGDLSKFAAEAFGADAFHFNSYTDLIKHIRGELTKDVVILVKGSRVMHMEDIVNGLKEGN